MPATDPEEVLSGTPEPTPSGTVDTTGQTDGSGTTSTPRPAPESPSQDAADEEGASDAREEDPESTSDASAASLACAGQQLTFVDLLWRTEPVDGVEAVFTGSGDTARTVLPMTAGERGLYTATIPEGPYDRVAFYPAGQADTAQPLGGVWRLDGLTDVAAQTVAFAAGTMSAFYYDGGSNPSYWGPAPAYDPAAAPKARAFSTLQTRAAGEPQPGDQLYFVNLHRLKGDETDPIVTVEAQFIQWPHDGTDSPNWYNGGQYIGRTMYEVRDGVYVTTFPHEILESSSNNESGYLYEEVAFDLTRQSGQKDPFNRHYNFRGQPHTSSVPGTWGTPGYFNYVAGTMDAYYYNTNVEDSYWNAHPSDADASIHGQMLYFDINDYGLTGAQQIGNLYLRWSGMPTSHNKYTYNDTYGFWVNTNTNTPGVLYFQLPTGQEKLSENTVFTLTYTIEEGSTLAGTYTFLFTYVPRSGFDCLMLDYLWEDTGEVWGNYQARPANPGSRGVYYNDAVTSFGKVQAVFGKKNGDGTYTWMSGADVRNAVWCKDSVVDAVQAGWDRGWLSMESIADQMVEAHIVPENVWAIENVPDEYTHVMFRGALDADASDSSGSNFWFTPPLEISSDYSYPCFFGYRYLDGTARGGASDKVTLEARDHSVLNGTWGSALEHYSLGDASVDVRQDSGFSNQSDVYYATTSLYDYYSTWEQSGQSITQNTYTKDEWDNQGLLLNLAVSSYFKQRDTAASDKDKVEPLYFGGGSSMDFKNKTDNWNALLTTGRYKNYGVQYGKDGLYNFTFKANTWEGNKGARTGLLDSTLNSDGDATIHGITVPYFSEAFLRGDNALGIMLGSAYKDLRFPFHQVDDKSDPFYGYWQFDSSKDGMCLKQGPDGSYYLDDRDTESPILVNGSYSYLPFNSSAKRSADEEALNYMFGQRVDLSFTVPEDGQVNMAGPGESEKMQDVIFEFQGDDDCWIFIDGQLVLDMGGIHDAVRGTINFHTKAWQIWYDLDNGTGGETSDEEKGNFHLTDTADGTHTLTMFYFERGLYASNLKLTFNFPQQNQLRVTKIVDESDVNPLFADAMDNLGAFEVHVNTMATSGQSLAVENSAGYVKTESRVFYEPGATGSATVNRSDGGEATEYTDPAGNQYLRITQPQGWDSGKPPAPANLLTLTPDGGTIDLKEKDYAFLELELFNATADNRGAQLYIQLQDESGKTVTASARTLGYLGEANLFLPNAQSLIRIDLNSLIAADPAFDRKKVTAVRIGLQNGTGAGSEDTGHYRLYRASFGTQWNLVLSTGFSVGDDQISDYGSLDADGKPIGYMPANGAWYTRQTTGEGGNVTESVASVVQNGSLSLANGQTAVFTDKFRVGSYLLLEENVDSNLFETSWSIHESGQPVSFNSLLPDRPNVSTVENPSWGFTRGETPLEDQDGDTPYDGRRVPDADAPEGASDVGFVYRSYLYPDNNENLPIDLEVIFRNKMRTGNFTIRKQLATSMKVGERYPVGVYTFDVYYTNVGGRGLEQLLPTQPMVEGIGDHYIHQVIPITTDATDGSGTYLMEGVPAGTQYIIRERPANGATLVGLEAAGGDSDSASPVQGGVTTGDTQDYTNAYIQDSTYLLEENQTEQDYPVYTFTNENKPFFMQIQKVWQGDPPANVEEIRIQVQRREVQRREAGTDDAWQNVTSDFFGGETGDTVTLEKSTGWEVSSQEEMPVYPTSGTEEDQTILYEYRIVEIGVGEGELASYRVEYTQVSGGTTSDGHSIVTYQAHNIPTGLTLQKTWLDNQNRDNTRPAAVRVQLQRSADYDPQDPTAQNVTWQTLDAQGQPGDENTYITLQSPDWSYTLEKLAASITENNTTKLYYYRLQEVQVQDTKGNWVSIAKQNIYEPAYSLPVTLGQAAALTVENALKTAEIQVIKQDAQNANKLLSGAEFLLQRLMQTAEGEWIVDTSWPPVTDTTDDDGTCTFTGLRPGRYRLTETKAPEGYQASLTPTDITLGAEHLKDTVRVTVKNSRPLTFAFIKVAAEDHTKVLAGAKFTLYALACGDASHTHTELLDPDDPGSCWSKVKDNVVSGDDGTVTFPNLAAGTYRLVETKAPAGYALPTGQWQVTLKADGSVTPVGINNPPAFLNEGGGLKLTNRKPMDMPSSGGPGVPLASALGVVMMGAGLLLTGRQLRKKRGSHPK